MITANDINQKLKDFMKTSDFKKRYAESISKDYKGGGVGAGAGGRGSNVPPDYDRGIRCLAQMIYKNTPAVLKDSFTVDDILYSIGAPVINSKGEATIGIDFNTAQLRRDSIEPKKYDGVENIVGLFIQGYTIPGNHRVWGYWRKHQGREHPSSNAVYIANRLSRKGDNFIQEAVDNFMNTEAANYNVIACTVSGYYITGKG